MFWADVTLVANGGPAGVTLFDAGLGWGAAPSAVTTSFTAVTVNVTGVPFGRPPNTCDVALGPAVCTVPLSAAMRYSLIAQPWLAGGVHDTVADVSPRTAVGAAGASGTAHVRTTGDAGLMLPGVVERGSRLIARTSKLTSVPLGMSSHTYVLVWPWAAAVTHVESTLLRTS